LVCTLDAEVDDFAAGSDEFFQHGVGAIVDASEAYPLYVQLLSADCLAESDSTFLVEHEVVIDEVELLVALAF